MRIQRDRALARGGKKLEQQLREARELQEAETRRNEERFKNNPHFFEHDIDNIKKRMPSQ